MSRLKLKISIGDICIKLEGDGKTVCSVYDEIIQNGFDKLKGSSYIENPKSLKPFSKPNLEQEENQEIVQKPDEGWPSLQNIVLQGKPEKEWQWILIYCAYCSEHGGRLFNLEDIRDKYRESSRDTESTRKNFTTNIKKLVKDGYISAVNDIEYRIDGKGLNYVKNLLFESDEDLESDVKSKKKKSIQPTPSYSIINLGLSEEDRNSFRTFWNNTKHESNIDEVLVAAYWLLENKSIAEVGENHIFTMLRVANASTSFNIYSALKNGKNMKKYYDSGSEPKTYKLNHIGQDFVTHELMGDLNG